MAPQRGKAPVPQGPRGQQRRGPGLFRRGRERRRCRKPWLLRSLRAGCLDHNTLSTFEDKRERDGASLAGIVPARRLPENEAHLPQSFEIKLSYIALSPCRRTFTPVVKASIALRLTRSTIWAMMAGGCPNARKADRSSFRRPSSGAAADVSL